MLFTFYDEMLKLKKFKLFAKNDMVNKWRWLLNLGSKQNEAWRKEGLEKKQRV